MPSTALNLDAQSALSMAQSQALPRTPKLGADASLDEVRKTAQEFEAVFLSQMLKPMFEGLKASEPFGGGPAEDMWQSLMVDEYGKSLAKSGGVGIADSVMAEMLKAQEMK